MLINSTRLKVLELCRANQLVNFDYEQQRLGCSTRLKDMVDSLASTVPFCLERFKAHSFNTPDCQTSITLNTNEEIKPNLASLTVWPLVVASSVNGIDVKQQQWFRAELGRLRRILGDGFLERAESRQWVTLQQASGVHMKLY